MHICPAEGDVGKTESKHQLLKCSKVFGIFFVSCKLFYSKKVFTTNSIVNCRQTFIIMETSIKKENTCSNCCAQQKEISNLVSSLARIGGNDGEENLSISAAISSLFCFWVGEEAYDVKFRREDLSLLLCAKCVQILQIVYNFSTQFIELSRKEGQVSKKLEELRHKVFNGQKTTPTSRNEARLRRGSRRFEDVTKEEERRPDCSTAEVKEEPLSLDEDEMQVDENYVETFNLDDNDEEASCPTPNSLLGSDYLPSESESDSANRHKIRQKEFPCPVEHCVRSFNRNDRLRHHLAHAHPEVPLPEKRKKGRPPLSSETRKYPCPEESCGRTFSRKDRLQQHAKSEHKVNLVEVAKTPRGESDRAHAKKESRERSDKKPRRRIDKPCPICGKLVRSTGLAAHKNPNYKKRIRIPTKSLCPTCGKLIRTSCLHTHIATHTAQKNIPCLQCDKLFRTERNLGIHVDEVHNKVRSICPHCGITCARKWALDQHVKTKHLDPAEKRYECETCGKSYRQERHLRHHVRLHDNEGRKDFTCPICSKVFCRKENVKLHLKSGQPCGNLYAEGKTV
ncbi:hypothetical protein Fcan01_16745 [Folsomia candida]|uniref:C2H2-type domain-containing protein n=1 Tax=Folsomia candida TaxID=158441 RepID=A0A226DVG1_FOLCA|nr:hypothetical protein Fcan01_16745 [Folsomia candida]